MCSSRPDTLDMIGQSEGAVRSRVPAESWQSAADRPWLHGDSAAGAYGCNDAVAADRYQNSRSVTRSVTVANAR